MLAIIKSIKHWRAELLSILDKNPFEVLTDNEALRYFGQKRVLSGRQIRWHEALQEYHFTATYRPGKDNVIADALSRKAEDYPVYKERQIAERTVQMLYSVNELQVNNPVMMLPEQLVQVNKATGAFTIWKELAVQDTEPWRLHDGILTYKDKLVVPG